MRPITTVCLLTLAACKPAENIRSGELVMCLANDAGTAIHASASAVWDVTGSVTAITEVNDDANPMLDCADDAGYTIDIQETDGTTWTIAYGILDQQGHQTAPAPDVLVGETVNLHFQQVEHTPPARGVVLVDGDGLVLAMDNGFGTGALENDTIDGLMVRRGLDTSHDKDECGKRSGTQIEFRTGETISLEPYTVSTVNMGSQSFDVYAISAFYWSKATCDDSADEMSWAVFR